MAYLLIYIYNSVVKVMKMVTLKWVRSSGNQFGLGNTSCRRTKKVKRKSNYGQRSEVEAEETWKLGQRQIHGFRMKSKEIGGLHMS